MTPEIKNRLINELALSKKLIREAMTTPGAHGLVESTDKLVSVITEILDYL